MLLVSRGSCTTNTLDMRVSSVSAVRKGSHCSDEKNDSDDDDDDDGDDTIMIMCSHYSHNHDSDDDNDTIMIMYGFVSWIISTLDMPVSSISAQSLDSNYTVEDRDDNNESDDDNDNVGLSKLTNGMLDTRILPMSAERTVTVVMKTVMILAVMMITIP